MLSGVMIGAVITHLFHRRRQPFNGDYSFSRHGCGGVGKTPTDAGSFRRRMNPQCMKMFSSAPLREKTIVVFLAKGAK